MITKLQKGLLWLFGAMFLVPEILWSPVGNFIFSLLTPPIGGYPQLLRNNFLFNSAELQQT